MEALANHDRQPSHILRHLRIQLKEVGDEFEFGRVGLEAVSGENGEIVRRVSAQTAFVSTAGEVPMPATILLRARHFGGQGILRVDSDFMR